MYSPLPRSSYSWHGSRPALSPKNQVSGYKKMPTKPISKQRAAGVTLTILALALTGYMWLFLHAESQPAVAALLVGALLLALVSRKLGMARQIEDAAARRPGLARLWTVLGVLALLA